MKHTALNSDDNDSLFELFSLEHGRNSFELARAIKACEDALVQFLVQRAMLFTCYETTHIKTRREDV